MSHPSPIPEYQYDDTQTFDIQTGGGIESWEQLMGETYQQQRSTSSTSNDQTGTFPFQTNTEELDPQFDYETIIRSKNLFYDPDPQVIRKTPTDNPMVYTQNIMIRFLQPPPVEQGPLIIREVRPPQPPPPPPLVRNDRSTRLVVPHRCFVSDRSSTSATTTFTSTDRSAGKTAATSADSLWFVVRLPFPTRIECLFQHKRSLGCFHRFHRPLVR